MMAFLISMVTGMGVPLKAAKPVIFGAFALLIVLAMWGGKCAYDHSIIATHDAKVEASQAKADRKADEAATAREEAQRERRDYETDQLTKAVEHAPKDPAIDDDRERALAFHRCLSLQQRARANGLKPPACV